MRRFFEPRLGTDLSGVRIHARGRSADLARAVNARAFTIGRDVVFGSGQFAPQTSDGRRLLAHELAHVAQQTSGVASRAIQRRISPEDVSGEMVGLSFEVAGPFSSGTIRLSGGEVVEVLAWDNDATTVRVRLQAPSRNAHVPFDIPKTLLRPIASGTPGIAPYSAGVEAQVGIVRGGEQRIERERTRTGGPRPGEIPRLEGLQRRRQGLLNRRLIQETMFNRFDSEISRWTDYYNRQFSYTGVRALDPNLVKSMLFQESQIGTAGEHLEDPPSHRVKTRFNIGQAVDSSGMILLTMMEEMQPSLITSYHLGSIRSDLEAAQRELRTLRGSSSPSATQRTRSAELTRLSRQNWEFFIWGVSCFRRDNGLL